MGQKLLSYLFYGFLVLMVVAALILLKYQMDQKDTKQQQIDSRVNVTKPNVVTRINTDKEPKNLAQNSVEKKNLQNPISDSKNSQSSPQNTDKTLTYLDVYKQMQNAKACQPFFDRWQKDGLKADLTSIVRPAKKFYGMADYLPSEQQPMSASQRKQLNLWHQICLKLANDYGKFITRDGGKKILQSEIAFDLERHLLTIVPKTAKEMVLKNTRKIATEWQRDFTQLEQVLAGEDSLEESQILALRAEIERLNAMRSDFSRELQDIDEPNEDEVDYYVDQQMQLYEQIRDIEKQISAQKVVDSDELSWAVADFESRDQALNKALYSHDGDVFFEALITIENKPSAYYAMTDIGFNYPSSSKANSYRITPNQIVLEQSQWHNPQLQGNTLKLATHLYMCDLGWNCGSDSVMMIQYCLFGRYANPDACGLDVRTFYQQHLISDNRWADVNQFKGYLKELFYD